MKLDETVGLTKKEAFYNQKPRSRYVFMMRISRRLYTSPILKDEWKKRGGQNPLKRFNIIFEWPLFQFKEINNLELEVAIINLMHFFLINPSTFPSEAAKSAKTRANNPRTVTVPHATSVLPRITPTGPTATHTPQTSSKLWQPALALSLPPSQALMWNMKSRLSPSQFQPLTSTLSTLTQVYTLAPMILIDLLQVLVEILT